MKRQITFISVLILVMNGGCFTEKVNLMVQNKNEMERVLFIDKALQTDSGNLYIEIAASDNKDLKKYYKFNFNYLKIIDGYRSYQKSNSVVTLSRKDYKKSGITSFYYESIDSVETFVFQFNRDFLLKNSKMDNTGNDIKHLISVYQSIENKSFYNPNEIFLKYSIETDSKKILLFNLHKDKKLNYWAFGLYPFSIVCDIITLPVQIVIIIKRLVDLKNPILKF